MKRIVYDYSKLRGRLAEKGMNYEDFAKKIGCSTCSVNQKINNHTEFKQTEIFRSMDVLGIAPEDISAYFFTR